MTVLPEMQPDDMSFYQDNDKLGAGMLFLYVLSRSHQRDAGCSSQHIHIQVWRYGVVYPTAGRQAVVDTGGTIQRQWCVSTHMGSCARGGCAHHNTHHPATVDMDMFAAAMRLSSEVLGYLPQHELQEEINLKYGIVCALFLALPTRSCMHNRESLYNPQIRPKPWFGVYNIFSDRTARRQECVFASH